MVHGGDRRQRHYSAFLSYSHSDRAFAQRLHRRLEAYRLPHRLARDPVSGATRPLRLKPVFRDRDDLAAAPHLDEAVKEALAQSDHLIIVCSPTAAHSLWVNLEVRAFRQMHGNDRFLTALLRGEPAEALPPALLEEECWDGPSAPLAADFRPYADGEHLALLKLLAALAQVPLDSLIQRDAQRRIRQVVATSALAVAIVAAIGLLGVQALRARVAQAHEQERSQGVVDYMLTDLRSRVKRSGRLDMLAAVNEAASKYYKGQDVSRLPPPAQIERAKLLQAEGDDDGKKGNYEAARVKFDEASAITSALLKARPNDPQAIFADAQSQYWNGFVRWRTEDVAGALAGYMGYDARTRQLTGIDPKNIDWQLERAYADSDLGMFVLRQSIDVVQARLLFGSAQAIFEAAAGIKPDDQDLQFSVADGYAWLADTERLAGNYQRALIQRTRQRRLLEAMLARDPRNFQDRAGIVSNTLAVARISAAQGKLAIAAKELAEARAAALVLMREEPADKDMARQARAIQLFQARTWLLMPRSLRPTESTIRGLIGDCQSDAVEAHNIELASFCSSVENRELRKVVMGQESSLLQSQDPRSPRLSERWLLDRASGDQFAPTTKPNRKP